MIQAVAAKFLDSIPFYTTADPKVNTALNLAPGRHTVLIKGDLQQVYTGEKDDEQAYIDWVRDNKYPLVTRIDSSNAKEILKGDRWVVLMVVGNDMAYEPFHAMARLTPGVLFAELNGQAWQSYVKRVYGITTFPTLLLVDPKVKENRGQSLWALTLSDFIRARDTLIRTWNKSLLRPNDLMRCLRRCNDRMH